VAVLGTDELHRFARDGWLLVPGVVPEPLLAAADEEIDGLIAESPPPEGHRGHHHWFPPVARLPRCDALLRDSPALAIAEELVAPLHLDHRFDHVQVATTIPVHPHRPGGPHIDGHGPGQEPPQSFTLLAGVLVTDQTLDQSGNLWVWPGSHLDHSHLFHDRGARVLQATGGHATMLDPPFAFGDPVEVHGRRGDLLLAHFLLGHNQGGNVQDWWRRTVYFRLAVAGHADRWESTFLDPWTEYEPVRVALAS
jgi:hypothetical protein